MTLAHQQLTDTILAAFYSVYSALGYGFLEKVYENALLHELRKRGLTGLKYRSDCSSTTTAL